MDFVLGGPARGEDFCFRAEFVSDLWECLKKNNILVVGPRRMGKTSVMYRLMDHPCDGYLPVYLNVEAVSTPFEFVIQLIFALREGQADYFLERLGNVWGLYKNLLRNAKNADFLDLRDALRDELNWEERWRDQAGQLINGIRMVNQPVLFIIDELPDMFIRLRKSSPERFEEFLHWFRTVREIPGSPIRWLVGGSTNLIGTLDQWGQAKLIGDFYHLVLPPFTAQEAENFALKVFSERKVNFDPGVIPRMRELLGSPIPFYLQLMTKELVDQWKRNSDEPLTKANVDDVCEKILLGTRALGHLQHFRARIDVYYPELEREAASDLLNLLSVSDGLSLKALFARYVKMESKRPQPRSERQLMQSFSRLLLLLQTDFYVEEVGERKYDFASRLIKMWWKKYYGSP